MRHSLGWNEVVYLFGMETTAKSDSRNPLLAKISSKLGGWQVLKGFVPLDPISMSVPQSESNDLNAFVGTA